MPYLTSYPQERPFRETDEMRLFLIATLAVLASCSSSKNGNDSKGAPPGTKAESKPTTSRLTGNANDTLTNGAITAHLEKLTQDIEDETGVTPGQVIFQLHVVVGNPRTVAMSFDSMQVTVFDVSGRQHVTSVQRGEQGQLEEIMLLPGQGTRAIAVVPQVSIPLPEKCSVCAEVQGRVSWRTARLYDQRKGLLDWSDA